MCYQCSGCNRCGKLSYRVTLHCGNCGGVIKAGMEVCPACGIKTAGNVYAGKLKFDPEAYVRRDKDVHR